MPNRSLPEPSSLADAERPSDPELDLRDHFVNGYSRQPADLTGQPVTVLGASLAGSGPETVAPWAGWAFGRGAGRNAVGVERSVQHVEARSAFVVRIAPGD